MAIDSDETALAPPIRLAHKKFPEESNFVMKVSQPPAEVKFDVPLPGSKSAVPVKVPLVYTFPKESVAIELPLSALAPPIRLAHKKFPEESNFEMKISSPPTEVKFDVPLPGSKSTVPLKKPVV